MLNARKLELALLWGALACSSVAICALACTHQQRATTIDLVNLIVDRICSPSDPTVGACLDKVFAARAAGRLPVDEGAPTSDASHE